MPASQEPSEYSSYSEDIAEIEVGVAHLLEQLVESIERSRHPDEIEGEAHEIALEAKGLAREIRNANFLDMGGHERRLAAVEGKARSLMGELLDALVYSEQKKWAGMLEDITANLHELREAHSFLSSALMHGRQQRAAHTSFLRMLSSTKAKLAQAKDGILHKKHAKGHAAYLKLAKIANAISKVQGHIKDEGMRKSREVLAPRSKIAGEGMKAFFARELEGKVHIDFDVIKMTSGLTGREEEWVHNEINGQAIEMLFEGTDMKGLVENARRRKGTVIANFECRADSGGLLAEFDAHERVITDEGIIARPYRARIFL